MRQVVEGCVPVGRVRSLCGETLKKGEPTTPCAPAFGAMLRRRRLLRPVVTSPAPRSGRRSMVRQSREGGQPLLRIGRSGTSVRQCFLEADRRARCRRVSSPGASCVDQSSTGEVECRCWRLSSTSAETRPSRMGAGGITAAGSHFRPPDDQQLAGWRGASVAGPAGSPASSQGRPDTVQHATRADYGSRRAVHLFSARR